MAKWLLLCSSAVIVVAIVGSVFYTWRNPMSIFNWQNRRALASAGFQKTWLQTPIGRQAVWEAGSGPTLIFLHGIGDHAGAWSKVAPSFTSKYHVIIPDLAGHEESEPSSGPLHMQTILAALDSLVAAKSDGQPVILVGNSLGGWVSFLYANQNPGRVTRIIATGGGPIAGERPDLIELPNNRAEMARMFDAVLDPGSPKPPGFVLDDLVRRAQTGPMARLVNTGTPELNRYLLDGKLQSFDTPVDLLWGESDRLVPVSYAKRLEHQLSAVRMTTVPRCGHAPQQECPGTYTKALRQVLEAPAPTSQRPLVSSTVK